MEEVKLEKIIVDNTSIRIMKSDIKLTLKMLLNLSIAERLQIIEQVLSIPQLDAELNQMEAKSFRLADTSPFDSAGFAIPGIIYRSTQV